MGLFSRYGLGNLIQVNGIMKGTNYQHILEENVVGKREEHALREGWLFQHDNDPKHTCHLVEAFLREKAIEVLDRPAQSPDLNPIEHLWAHLDGRLTQERRRNKKELFETLRISGRQFQRPHSDRARGINAQTPPGHH